MTGEVLIDSNVFVYAYDARQVIKQRRAVEMLDHLAGTGNGRISTQVLGEVFRALTSRIDPRLPVARAVEQIVNMASSWPVLSITPVVALQAAAGVRDHQLNYWDSQLWATARLNQIPVILTEDFAHGRALESVRYVNPFSTAFDPAELS